MWEKKGEKKEIEILEYIRSEELKISKRNVKDKLNLYIYI